MTWVRVHGSVILLLLIALSGAVWPIDKPLLGRLALAWGLGVCLYIALTLFNMARDASPDRIRDRAALLDAAGPAITPFALLAAAASLAAVLGEVAGTPGEGVGQASFGLITVALSWLFTHLIFALHYAHAFYGRDATGKDRGGLIFPGDQPPDYWDFLHFALIIGVASQTADIEIADKGLRRLSTWHSLIAFTFNTVILALAVNLAVAMVG